MGNRGRKRPQKCIKIYKKRVVVLFSFPSTFFGFAFGRPLFVLILWWARVITAPCRSLVLLLPFVAVGLFFVFLSLGRAGRRWSPLATPRDPSPLSPSLALAPFFSRDLDHGASHKKETKPSQGKQWRAPFYEKTKLRDERHLEAVALASFLPQSARHALFFLGRQTAMPAAMHDNDRKAKTYCGNNGKTMVYTGSGTKKGGHRASSSVCALPGWPATPALG